MSRAITDKKKERTIFATCLAARISVFKGVEQRSDQRSLNKRAARRAVNGVGLYGVGRGNFRSKVLNETNIGTSQPIHRRHLMSRGCRALRVTFLETLRLFMEQVTIK